MQSVFFFWPGFHFACLLVMKREAKPLGPLLGVGGVGLISDVCPWSMVTVESWCLETSGNVQLCHRRSAVLACRLHLSMAYSLVTQRRPRKGPGGDSGYCGGLFGVWDWSGKSALPPQHILSIRYLVTDGHARNECRE